MRLEDNGFVSGGVQARRRSDAPDFIESDIDLDAVANEIFSQYSGTQRVVVDGAPYTATFFDEGYCPDFRVMRLAGELAFRIHEHSDPRRQAHPRVPPLRVTIREIMLAALLHDLGKQHEDCAPFLDLLKATPLRSDSGADSARRKGHLLDIVRDVHCRKGPCMIDRLRDAGRSELDHAFFATVARRHGDDYEVNCRNGWWSREINVITIADDYDAMTSEGPERAYKPRNLTVEDAARILRAGMERGRYEPAIADIFITDVLNVDA
jgi:hypothetical protein